MTGPIDPDDYPEHTIRSLRPEPKVVAGTVAGAATIVAVWVLGLFGLEVPSLVAAAITGLFTAGLAYLTPNRY